jgi:hypothetical protein
MPEQRNPYRGSRPWLRLGFKARDGAVHHLNLVADTGSAAGVIVRSDWMTRLMIQPCQDRPSNFGLLIGGWLRLYNPSLGGFVELIRGFANDTAAHIAARAHPDFVGLVGLPVLRMGEYGGNADAFWFRYPPQ